jgi:capsular polysaccharide biosynthesis protein
VDDVLLLPLLRRWWWVLLSAAVLAAVVGVGAASLMTPTYSADAQLLVGPINGDANTLQAAGQLSRTYADLADSRPVVVSAARAAGVRMGATKLQAAVSGSANEITRVVDVRVELHDAAQATALANAIGNGLIALSKGTPKQVDQAVQGLLSNAELQHLAARQPGLVQALAARLSASLAPGQLQVVQPAVRPSSPSSPKRAVMGLLGALAGALLAGVLLFVRESSTRTRLRTPAVAAQRGGEDRLLDDSIYKLEQISFLQEAPGGAERRRLESR